jgi:hypothetical protein
MPLVYSNDRKHQIVGHGGAETYSIRERLVKQIAYTKGGRV